MKRYLVLTILGPKRLLGASRFLKDDVESFSPRFLKKDVKETQKKDVLQDRLGCSKEGSGGFKWV